MIFQEENIWLNINKPRGLSSAKVVAIVKRLTKAKKVGHGGTLDVMADGVLPIALNKATKTSQAMMDRSKKYFFRIKWGSFTTTDDEEGEIVESNLARPQNQDLIAILPDFIGLIKQVPSKFSAIKINGKRAYELARKNVEFEMKEREITIFSLKMLENNQNFADFEVSCSKGTYVRTLAFDICKKVQVCGHVCVLTRLEVGDFKIENSKKIEEIIPLQLIK